tara:strand:- start:1160 stop:1504 length:345 start_codon:yes stop_codon:yes gene_type:complete
MSSVSVGKNLVATVKTTMYTVPAKYAAEWELLFVSNDGVPNNTIDVHWYDSSQNVEINILPTYPLAAHEFLKFDGLARIVLEQGDKIYATSSAASVITCVVTLKLIPARNSSLT